MPTTYFSKYNGKEIMAKVATGGREIASNLVPDRPNRQGEVLTLSGSSPAWTQDEFVDVDINVIEPPVPELVLDGKEYQLVNINGVWWTAENLDYQFSGLTVGTSGYSTSQKKANYVNNNEATYGWNGKKYGLLYNWVAVKYIEDHKAELIPGWHVPTKDEYQALVDACNPDAGTKLKSTTDWSSGNGTDLYGFNAKPAGSYTGSDFSSIGYNAYLWTSTSGSSDAYYVSLNIDSYASVTNDDGMKGLGMAVRLVKDA